MSTYGVCKDNTIPIKSFYYRHDTINKKGEISKMSRKIRQAGIEYTLAPEKDLVGTRFAWAIESIKTIFVSPSIFSLLETDTEITKKYLKTLKMPKNEDGADKFGSLQEWISEVSAERQDAFVAGKNEKNESIQGT